MQSFLIVSKNKKTALEYSLGECKENQIDKFDVSILNFEKTIGIEDIRNFQKKIILKPIRSKTKAVVLNGSNGLTIEAQNALLKILEEPPPHTIIYITISNKDLMLPTILSRCKIIDLKDKEPQLSKEEIAQYLNILISLLDQSVGYRLKLAQDITKNKDNVIPWLEKMIIVARQTLIDSVCHSDPELARLAAKRVGGKESHDKDAVPQYLNILISLNKTYAVLKTTNVNQRLALENLFLHL